MSAFAEFPSKPFIIASSPIDIFSIDFLNYLTREVIATDICIGSIRAGDPDDFAHDLDSILADSGVYKYELAHDLGQFGEIPSDYTPEEVDSYDKGSVRHILFNGVYSTGPTTYTVDVASAIGVNLHDAAGVTQVAGSIDESCFWVGLGCVYQSSTTAYPYAAQSGSVDLRPEVTEDLPQSWINRGEIEHWQEKTSSGFWIRANLTTSTSGNTMTMVWFELSPKVVPAGYWQHPPIYQTETSSIDIA